MPTAKWDRESGDWKSEPLVKDQPLPGAPMGIDPENKGRDDKVNRMGTGNIPLLIMEFAIPSIVGMLVNGAYNIINAVFLGAALHELGQAAVTAANPISIVFIAISMLCGNGGNALAALRLGEGDRKGAERSLGNTFTLCAIMSVVVACLAFIPPCINTLLTISGTTPEVWDMAKTFIQILSLGFIFQCIGLGVNNFIRTAGRPNRALGTMVVGAVVCIIVNYLFVIVLGFGVAGSAAATVIGQAASCACVIWFFTRTKNVSMKLHLKNLKPEARTVTMILKLGFASFALQVAAAIVNFVLNNLLVKYGAQSPLGTEAALASIGVVSRIAMFILFPLIGVAVAIQPLIGFNYGAHLYKRVRTTLVDGIILATIIGTILWLCVQLFARQIIGFFGLENPELVDFAVFALKVQLIFIPLVGFQVVGSNYFQATGQPGKSAFLSVTRQLLFLIPLYLTLPEVLPQILPDRTSLDALYFAIPIADLMSICVTMLFLLRERIRMKKLESGELKAKSF